MAKRLKTKQDVAAENARKIAQGRCQGVGPRYVPWSLVREFASRGQSARIFGRKTGRIHHLFSLLEQQVFFFFEWLTQVTDIREQFVLPLDETLALAKRHGIRHPQVRGEPVPLTTDFLLTIERDGQYILLARAVKYLKDLDPATQGSARTRAKLELERLYWEAQGVDWALVTDRDVPSVFVRNVGWARPYQRFPAMSSLSADQLLEVSRVLTARILATEEVLGASTKWCDVELGHKKGTALAVSRYLIGTGQWEVDMHMEVDAWHRVILISCRIEPGLLEEEAA